MSLQPDSLGLRGRVALVTGASRGIGRATALRLAEQGVDLVINYVNDETAAESLATEARSLGIKAITIRADVSSLVDAERLVDRTIAEFKKIDVLVCNAGIWQGHAVEELSEEI